MIGLKIVATGLLVFFLGCFSSMMVGPGPINQTMIGVSLISVPVGILLAIWYRPKPKAQL